MILSLSSDITHTSSKCCIREQPLVNLGVDRPLLSFIRLIVHVPSTYMDTLWLALSDLVDYFYLFSSFFFFFRLTYQQSFRMAWYFGMLVIINIAYGLWGSTCIDVKGVSNNIPDSNPHKDACKSINNFLIVFVVL